MGSIRRLWTASAERGKADHVHLKFCSVPAILVESRDVEEWRGYD